MSSASPAARTLAWPAPQWLALFYDLAFAASVIALSTSYGFDHSFLGAVWFATAYGILASAWLLTGGATGAFTGRPRAVTGGVVIVVVIQMATVLMLALASGDTIAASSVVFDILLGILAITCLGLAALARGGSHAIPTRSLMLILAAIATLILAWLLPDAASLATWIVALALLAAAAGLVVIDGRVDIHRFAHRIGELTIIIIGEILVKVALTVGEESLWAVRLLALVPTLLLLTTTWWAYFTGPVHVRELTRNRRLVCVTAHWMLHISLLGLAVGLGKLLVGSSTLNESGAVAALLTLPALLLMASLTLLDWATGNRRVRVFAVATLIMAGAALLIGLANVNPSVVAYVLAAISLLAVLVGNYQRQETPAQQPAG